MLFMTFPDCYFRHFHVATTPKKDQNHQVLISALDTMINAKALMTWSIYFLGILFAFYCIIRRTWKTKRLTCYGRWRGGRFLLARED